MFLGGRCSGVAGDETAGVDGCHVSEGFRPPPSILEFGDGGQFNPRGLKGKGAPFLHAVLLPAKQNY